jgi:hypothetical protein
MISQAAYSLVPLLGLASGSCRKLEAMRLATITSSRLCKMNVRLALYQVAIFQRSTPLSPNSSTIPYDGPADRWFDASWLTAAKHSVATKNAGVHDVRP